MLIPGINKRTILIGNGINQIDPANSFSASDISARFQLALIEAKDIFNVLFLNDVDMQNVDLFQVSNCALDDNIECILGKIYRFIKGAIDPEGIGLRDNIQRRLITILLQVGLKAIYIKDECFYCANVPVEYATRITEYGNWLTLNYYELWDMNHSNDHDDPRYIHGNFFQEKYKTQRGNKKKPIMFASSTLYEVIQSYKEVLDELSDRYDIVYLEEHENIIMIPDVIRKGDYCKGLYLSDNLFPDCDLFPRDDRDIYSAFDQLDYLDIFGMSPYGDESLLEKINCIRNIRIFVYKLNEAEGAAQAQQWRAIVPHAELIDSSEFLR